MSAIFESVNRFIVCFCFARTSFSFWLSGFLNTSYRLLFIIFSVLSICSSFFLVRYKRSKVFIFVLKTLMVVTFLFCASCSFSNWSILTHCSICLCKSSIAYVFFPPALPRPTGLEPFLAPTRPPGLLWMLSLTSGSCCLSGFVAVIYFSRTCLLSYRSLSVWSS